MTLGEKLKEARKQAGLSQEQMAVKLNVSRSAVAKWETDKGIPRFLNQVKNLDKEYYLVNQNDRQFLVVVSDEFMESRELIQKQFAKKFEIGNLEFVNCGPISGA